MSIFTEHPAARWGLPAAALGVIGVAALTLNQTASADAGLPPRTAQQLLADVRSADVSSLSGTVVQTSDLGLPQLPGLTGGGPAGGGAGGSGGLAGAAGSSLTSLLSGTHTWRIWLDGPTRQRLALVGTSGESDVIRNGSDLWLWSSADKTAVHHTLSTDHAGGAKGKADPPPLRPSGLPSGVPSTPDQAASAALAAMGKDTAVTTSGAASVAGRPAYELVLTPKDRTTRVASVRIAIDAEKHVPLRVQVYSTKLSNPAFEVGFTAVDFSTPEARQFSFTPPAGTTVTQSGQGTPKGAAGTNPAPSKQQAAAAAAKAAGATHVVGSGWSTVVVAPMPTSTASGSGSGTDSTTARQLAGLLKALPTVSGSWGSGHVLEGTLFSAVVTDDGRVAVGAVAPEALYAALAAK